MKYLKSVSGDTVYEHIVINRMPPSLQDLIKLGVVLKTDNDRSQGSRCVCCIVLM